MIDIVDKQTRSRMMSGIRGKDTKPELALRKALHARGFRFRLHPKDICGRPDLVLQKYEAVIFIHGCFWHRHSGCRYASVPATRPDFWQRKFASNIERDRYVDAELRRLGWRVGVVWECALKKENQIDETADMVAAWLRSGSEQISIGSGQHKTISN